MDYDKDVASDVLDYRECVPLMIACSSTRSRGRGFGRSRGCGCGFRNIYCVDLLPASSYLHIRRRSLTATAATRQKSARLRIKIV